MMAVSPDLDWGNEDVPDGGEKDERARGRAHDCPLTLMR